MIGSLRGRVIDLAPPWALIEVQGIGYRVCASSNTLAGLRTGEEVFVYTHDVVREDARDLYGFTSLEDLRLFERMISVSGVGPKVALAMSSIGSAETLKRAIMSGDLSTLTSAPGVGKKIAQKIILELKGQIVDTDGITGPDREAIDALVSLGYSATQARDALKLVPADISDISDRVREALRMLGR
jgi:Holliday junction DNA helicase RuvA